MRRISAKELEDEATSVGLVVQHDCGGYRLVISDGPGWRYVFPNTGICPAVPKRDCMTFLAGYRAGLRQEYRYGGGAYA